jgi:mannose-6-phosphate isomerase
MAADLHRWDPQQFTDPNHKPEIALALTDFEAFCGFKPLEDVDRLLNLPPLRAFRPDVSKPSFDDQTLKYVVREMLKASEETVRRTNKALLDLPKESFGKDGYIHELLPRLEEQYGEYDNGTLVALITMNYLQLKPGQSIYIPADGIHAYLSGDIIECMARSNNVLNTGFCPKADRNSVDTFVSCLAFTPHGPNECILEPRRFERSKTGKTSMYAPPMSEFNMLKTELGGGESETISRIDGPSIVLVSKGSGTLKAEGREHKLSEGYVFFIGHGVELQFDSSDGLQIFTAFVE